MHEHTTHTTRSKGVSAISKPKITLAGVATALAVAAFASTPLAHATTDLPRGPNAIGAGASSADVPPGPGAVGPDF